MTCTVSVYKVWKFESAIFMRSADIEGRISVMIAVNAIFEIFEASSPKQIARFFLEFRTPYRVWWPLTIGEVSNFFESQILGSRGSNFEN